VIDESNIPDEPQPATDAASEVEQPAGGAEVEAGAETALPADAPAEPSADAAVTEAPPVEGPTEVAGAADEPVEETEEPLDDDVDVQPIEEVLDDEDDQLEDVPMNWYILKVQSNREKSICEALRKRVAVAGMERFFGEVIVPTEDVAEFKNGKRRVIKRKLYPGYIVVQMSLTEDTWFLVRETSGIGDFTGSAGRPSPMLQHEVDRIVRASQPEEEGTQQVKTVIPFKVGDRVRIKEGTFENFEGDVDNVDEANGRVTVMINIFGRSTPVELEHWQIESV